jgi:predicted metal-dependent hydrolase
MTERPEYGIPQVPDPAKDKAKVKDSWMILDWNGGALAEGLRCYREGEFFMAHEHWEGVWLACQEPEKTFLQALIQVAAAFHHWQRGNAEGTASLLRSALRKLGRYPDEFEGIAVESLRQSLLEWLDALSSPQPIETPSHLSVPTIL